MQLTRHTDIALRVLLLLADVADEGMTADEVATRFRVNRHHLAKVVQALAKAGHIQAKRGAGGGLTLARAPRQINLGVVVRELEPTLDLLECFDAATSTCPITDACRLQGVLSSAQAAFFAVLDRTTLADLMVSKGVLSNQLALAQR
jgi:Rrf2 family nitric oxide-sensitive transcriptional repressor